MKVMPMLWKKLVVKHKKCIAGFRKMSKEDKPGILKKANDDSLKLILHYFNYKCVKCDSEKYLTRHHLIDRRIKSFLEEDFYLSVRYYWANSVILCSDCHSELHWDVPSEKVMVCINSRKVYSIKKYFNTTVV